MLDIKKRIEALEHQIFIASAEDDYHQVNQLEKQLEHLKGSMNIPDKTDPYAPEGHPNADNEWE